MLNIMRVFFSFAAVIYKVSDATFSEVMHLMENKTKLQV